MRVVHAAHIIHRIPVTVVVVVAAHYLETGTEPVPEIPMHVVGA